MDASKLNKAKEIFQLVVDLPVEERESGLAAQCGDDADLRTFVEQLLRSDAEGMGEFMREPVFTPPPDSIVQPEGLLPKHIGRYEIIRVIGEGGMGRAYLVWRNTCICAGSTR